MKKGSQMPKFDWRTFIATTAITFILSLPSWLPVFGVQYADFGAAFVAGFVGFSPVLFVALGFVVGWHVRNYQAEKERIKLGMTIEEAAEKLDAQRAEDLALLDKMNKLDSDYKRLLAWLYVEGSVESSLSNEFFWLIDSAVEPGEIEDQDLFFEVLTTSYEQPDGVSRIYELKPRTRSLMEEDKKIFPPFIEEVRSGQLAEFTAWLKAFKERNVPRYGIQETQEEDDLDATA